MFDQIVPEAALDAIDRVLANRALMLKIMAGLLIMGVTIGPVLKLFRRSP